MPLQFTDPSHFQWEVRKIAVVGPGIVGIVGALRDAGRCAHATGGVVGEVPEPDDRNAVAAPMPEPAPVINATLPCKRLPMTCSLIRC